MRLFGAVAAAASRVLSHVLVVVLLLVARVESDLVRARPATCISITLQKDTLGMYNIRC